MAYLYRILRFALQDFYRNIWLSLVTISILILTLLSINVLIGFNVLTKTAVSVIESKVDISVNFKSSVTEGEINNFKNDVMKLPEVAGVEYISQAESLQQFKDIHKADQIILDTLAELGDNPLGAIIKIKARNLEGYANILKAIDQPEYNKLVSSKDYYNRQEMINKVSGWTKAGEKIVLSFILFFILISALIVFNTIRVAIYTHREEIGIEKLVGATNWFVALPFIAESVIYALVACVINVALTYPLLNFAQPYLVNFFGTGQIDLVSYFNSHFIWVFGLQFGVVTVLNVIASFFATRKYLRV